MIDISVIITSYNRAHLVERAIRSVLDQDFSRLIQIIVIDDGSTDNSDEVIREALKQNRKWKTCKDFIPTVHRGIMHAYITAFKEAKGKYIAFCDCDDYWIDKSKLSKQYEYMESNPEIGICFHRCAIETNFNKSFPAPDFKMMTEKLTFDNLLIGNAFIFAQSYFIRKQVFDYYINLDGWYSKMYVWDYPILLKLIKHTKFGYLDFYGAVFTIDGESYTNVQTRMKRLKMIAGQLKIKLYFIRRYGCKLVTLIYLCYWFGRSIYSIILKRWYK